MDGLGSSVRARSAASLCPLVATPLAAQQPAATPRTKIDVSKLGPQVGQTVPDFSLSDQNGKVWTRASIMGTKGALPLSDAGSATIKAFGILNPMPEMAFGPDKDDPEVIAELQKYVSGGTNPSWVGIAFPGTFILDPQGKVVSRFFEDYIVERATFSTIMLKRGRATAPMTATRISGTHVDLTTDPSDTSLAAGNRFSLAVNVAPHAGVHVYAPGASGYRVIGVTVKPQPFLRITPATYPKSEIYFFKPLNERVPVFQKSFTLVQESVLEGTPARTGGLPGQAVDHGRRLA
jgi:hypothetical protein